MRNKREKTQKGRAKTFFSIFISISIVTLTCLFGGNISQYFSGLAVVAAGLALPEGGAAAVRELLSTEPESSENKKTKSSQGYKIPTIIGLNKNKTQQQPANMVNIEYLTKTPDDVAETMKKTINAAKGQETGGITLEENFALSSGTDLFEKVSVKNTSGRKIDIPDLLTRGINISYVDAEPLVLIYHSHTTETFCPTDNGTFPKSFKGRTENEDENIVRVGREIANELEQAGISVIHDTEIHDKIYNESYGNSRKSVIKYLEQYPSIQVCLDVHRDAIHYDSKTYSRPTSEIFGKKAAQIMILTGTETDKIKDFPNWEQNLDLALALHNYGENMYEGLMRPLMFCQRKYNLDLGKYSLLLEMGSDGNTLEEAVYAGRLMGNVLAALLLDYME